MSDTFRACLLMTAAMAAFAIEDMIIKLLAAELPAGQIIFILGIGGTAFFGILSAVRGRPVLTAALRNRLFLGRNAAEMLGMMAGITALTLIPLSLFAAILQAAPLLVTIGAGLFLRERIGWRRWAAVGIGMVGVLMILRPGSAAFNPAAILAVFGVVCMAGRDLMTRVVPANVTTLQMAFWAYALTIPAGVLMMLASHDTAVWPSPHAWGLLALGQVLGIIAYYTITLALRLGQVSAVIPFRYTRLVFATALGVLVLGEKPDAWMIGGAALVILSGLFTLLRESRYLKASPTVAPSL